jgi:predicted deacylase
VSHKIAGLETKPGSRASGSLTAGARPASHVDVPFTVIRGMGEGATLCVTAGVHGTEYAGIGAAIRLARMIDAERLNGTLIVVPVVNVPAFEARSYVCPIDGVNIQGSFPGKADGTIAQLIAHRVYGELVSRSTHYLDLHGGDTHESEIAFSGFFVTGTAKVDAVSEQMARALGFEYVWRTDKEGFMAKGSTWRTAPENGIPSALAEYSSGDKLLEEEAVAMYDGVVNVMRKLRMLDGKPKIVKGQKVVTQFTPITVRHGGLLHLLVRAGDSVAEGHALGELMTLQGEVLETVKAPMKGVVLVIIHNPVVEPGQKVVYLGT